MSRTSSSRASGRQVESVFNNFDTTRRPMTRQSMKLLEPKNNPMSEYNMIRFQIKDSRQKTVQTVAAMKIQTVFRMFITRKKYYLFFVQFRKYKRKTETPYFAAFVLNSFAFRADRNKLFSTIAKTTLTPNGMKNTSYECFSVTGMFRIPKKIKEKALIKTVHAFYDPIFINYFNEWRLVNKKSRVDRKKLEEFKLDETSQHRFGNYYICFQLWFKFTQLKKHPNEIHTAQLNAWTNYLKIRNYKNKRISLATEHHLKNIKSNALQSLQNILSRKKHEQMIMNEAINTCYKNIMIYALKAWLKYIVDINNRSSSMKFVIRRWLGAVYKKHHIKMVYEQVEKRHNMYLKMRGLGAFHKNRRIAEVLQTYSYLKAQDKPSLALYFIALLKREPSTEVIAHTFHAWITKIRRRQNWHQFVFENIAKTEYEPTKRKALTALRRRTVHPTITPVQLISTRFKQESVQLYQRVMQGQNEPTNMFLMLTEEMANKFQQKESKATSMVAQRNVFFETWRHMDKDISLFMRLTGINMMKKWANQKKDEFSYEKRVEQLFKKAISYLATLNVASEQKFSSVLRLIEENKKRALINRSLCHHRDKLLLNAHASHADAQDFHDVKPQFVPQNGLILKTVHDAQAEIEKSFKLLIPIGSLGTLLEQPNEVSFGRVLGCTVIPPSSQVELLRIREKIKSDNIRTELGHDVISRFDQLLGSKGFSNSKQNNKLEAYHVNTKDVPKPAPSTGINKKLNERFPNYGRVPHVLVNPDAVYNEAKLNLDEEEEEVKEKQEKKVDVMDEVEENLRSKELLNMDRSQGSQFFNRLNTSALLQNSGSLSSFMSRNSSEELQIEEVMQIEEIQPPKEIDVKDVEQEKVIDFAELDPSSIGTGFDEALMKSIGASKEITSPRVAKKYEQFLEILFGKQSKDTFNSGVMTLRRKLITEYRNRTPSLAARGIDTKDLVLGVTGFMEKYRHDKKVKAQQIRISALSNESRKKRNPEEELTQTEFKYNSRRFYRPKPPKDEGDEEEDDDDSFIEDIKQLGHLNETPTTKDTDVTDVVNDADIDPTADRTITDALHDLTTAQDLITPYLASKKLEKVSSTMGKVNKVVFHLLESTIHDQQEEGLLVELDPEEVPDLGLEGIGGIINLPKPSHWKKPKMHPLYKTRKFPKRQTIIKTNKGKPSIVIPTHHEITPSMKKIIKEDDPLAKLIFNEGHNFNRKAKIEEDISSSYKPVYKTVQQPIVPIAFKDKSQVVSFGSGKQFAPKKGSLINVRIANSKYSRITKPLAPIGKRLPSEPAPDINGLRNIVEQLVNTMNNKDSTHEVETLQRRARYMRNYSKYKPTDGDETSRSTSRSVKRPASPTELIHDVQEIYSRFMITGNLRDTGNKLLSLVNKNSDIIGKIIVQTLDRVIKENGIKEKRREQMMKSQKRKLRTTEANLNLAVSYVDIEWIDDIQYAGVVVQYKEEGEELDALIAPTDIKPRSVSTSKMANRSQFTTPSSAKTKWDEIIDSFDINEMMAVIPYTVSENEIDQIIRSNL